MTLTGDQIAKSLQALATTLGPEAFAQYMEAERRVRGMDQRREVLASIGAALDLDQASAVVAVRSWLGGKLNLAGDTGIRELEGALYALPSSKRAVLMPMWRWLLACSGPI